VAECFYVYHGPKGFITLPKSSQNGFTLADALNKLVFIKQTLRFLIVVKADAQKYAVAEKMK
jgi:hypothetical protein